MTTRLEHLTRPEAGSAPGVRTRHRRVGYAVASAGMLIAIVSFVASLAAAGLVESGDSQLAEQTLAWNFGLNTAAFGTIKLAIAIVLTGILVRLWLRVESVKEALARLKPSVEANTAVGETKTPYGKATFTKEVPRTAPRSQNGKENVGTDGGHGLHGRRGRLDHRVWLGR